MFTVLSHATSVAGIMLPTQFLHRIGFAIWHVLGRTFDEGTVYPNLHLLPIESGWSFSISKWKDPKRLDDATAALPSRVVPTKTQLLHPSAVPRRPSSSSPHTSVGCFHCAIFSRACLGYTQATSSKSLPCARSKLGLLPWSYWHKNYWFCCPQYFKASIPFMPSGKSYWTNIWDVWRILNWWLPSSWWGDPLMKRTMHHCSGAVF
jgi:hypothetical protein